LDDLSTSRADQKQLIVDKHNALRRAVNPPASDMMKMEWNTAAAENAQKWANQCTLRHSTAAMRATDKRCGENLYMSTAPSSWSRAIDAWYNEDKNFEYGTGANPQGSVIGHYTQLIWYNSYLIGCAVAYCPRNQFNYFYVCQYCPAGNNPMQIATPYKSGPKCADCPGHCDKGLCTNPCKYQDFFANCRNLKSLFGCNHSLVKEKCPASCRCTTQII
ncbi:CRIS2 protein, partial [Oreotrochilus melanogaster]|nr:CRIS2 protein [Oreotrochilus melanogaster]